jgi:hypothetical protein
MMRSPRSGDQPTVVECRTAEIGLLRDLHGSHLVGNEDTEEKECAGNSDEGKKEVKCLFYARFVHGSDGSEIDQNTETQSEE